MENESVIDPRESVDSGIFSMALLSRHKGERLSSDVLVQNFGHLPGMDEQDMMAAFKEMGFKTKALPFNAKSIESLPFPCIVVLKNQTYAVLLDVSEGDALVHTMTNKNAIKLPVDELIEGSAGRVILAVPETEGAQQPGKFGLNWFLSTLFKYRSIMRETLLASFFIQLFALVTPLFFMVIIDKVFSHNNMSTLDVLVFAMVVVAVFDVILSGIRTWLLSHTTNRVDLELGVKLFKHMMALPLSYFESRRTGDTVARIREVETIRNFLTGSSLTLIIDLLFIFIFLAVMYLFSGLLTAIVILSLPLFFLVSAVLTPLMKNKLEDKHEKIAENQSYLVETLGGIEAIKSGAVEPQQQREWENKLSDYARCSFNSSSLSNMINQSTSLISKCLTITVLYIGAKLVLSGDLSIGQLIAFNMLSARVIAPIQRLAQIWQEFTSMRVSVKRIADILDAPKEPMQLTSKTELPPLQGTIQFDKVDYQYDETNKNVLNDISFTVAPGEVIGVVGSTGSGKTTLVKLLQRLYVPVGGRILVDGIDIATVDGSWLRRQIGVVAQDFVLFNRTVRENITMGDPAVSDAHVIEVAQQVGAHEMIMQLANGYDTELYERGRGLSTGQWQSIAMVRALVKDPAILILDEATSALDYESEQNFQKNFHTICEGRTVFVVAHRLSTVRYANRILTLEDGRLIEDDSPQVLLEKGGRFANLHAIHSRTWPLREEVAYEG
ncbi:MAG: peptidase domain-containing ABC transporter [Arenicellales bacterium]